MSFRRGLNRQDQIKCAMWLEEGIDPVDIAKKFKTTPEIVKRFTRAKLDEAKRKADERMQKANRITQKRKETAAVVSEIIESKGDFE